MSNERRVSERQDRRASLYFSINVVQSSVGLFEFKILCASDVISS